MNNMILTTDNLTKRYGNQRAVDNLSLAVPQNTVYGLLGPNGAGKSTTLKMIAGVVRPSEGHIVFDGKPWERNSLKDIGALIEIPPLYENLTAYENLLVRATALEIEKSRIEKVLGIVDTRKKKTKQSSMGMKQRLGIALALINNPKLLILDEPTNGLDPLGIQDLRQQIRSFPAQGITVIFSSHILAEVKSTVDEIGIIANGQLGYQGELPREAEALEELFMQVAKATRNGGDNMKSLIQSEFIKGRRTFGRKSIMEFPLMVYLLAIFLMGGQLTQVGAYSWLHFSPR